MTTTDQIEVIRVELDKTVLLPNFTTLGHDWLGIWKQHCEVVLKRNGIAVVEDEILEYNALGVK